MQVCLANSSTKGRLPPAHRHDKKVFTMAGITEKQKNIFHHAREIIKQDESIPEEEPLPRQRRLCRAQRNDLGEPDARGK